MLINLLSLNSYSFLYMYMLIYAKKTYLIKFRPIRTHQSSNRCFQVGPYKQIDWSHTPVTDCRWTQYQRRWAVAARSKRARLWCAAERDCLPHAGQTAHDNLFIKIISIRWLNFGGVRAKILILQYVLYFRLYLQQRSC